MEIDMSGPKVVRIVTREEIVALCEGHLARLHTAVEEWIKIGRRNGTLTEVEISATQGRYEALRSLLAQDRFVELQKAVPDEIAFLRADHESRLARAAEAKAKARVAQRRTEGVAASILITLERRGVPVPAELHSALEDAAAGRSDGTTAISQAFALLSDKKDTGVSDHQRWLADALKDTNDRQSFNQWLASQSTSIDDEDFLRLDLRIAELAVILGEASTREFEARLRRLFSNEPSPHRSLLMDSLELDLVQAVTKARDQSALQSRLRMLAAELSQLGHESAEALSRSIVTRVDEPSVTLIELEKEATTVLSRFREEAAAQSRRHAILKGLTDLGYQVSEGLETAWVRDGKVVLKKASQSGYGVEIGGRVDSGRVQMRTVAIRNTDAPADAARDRDAETIFCSDMTKLQAQFAEAGGGIVIERALPVGATPLRVVPDTSDTGDEDIQERIPDRVRRI
jgi:hypothetical protein